jgi:glutamyl-tRNA reductase
MSMILVAGLSRPSAPLDLLERTSVPHEQLPKALADLRDCEYVREAVIVSTCLRTEIYVVVDRYHAATAELRRFISRHSGLDEDQVSGHLYAYEGQRAVDHLFRLAGGLESASLGESEILGQLRRAEDAATLEGAAGPALIRLFRAARRAGRRARAETAIGRGSASLARAAVTLASRRLGDMRVSQAVVLGAGEVGTDAARALRAAHPEVKMTVLSRSPERAAALATRVSAEPAGFDQLPAALSEAEMVFTCTSAPEPVVTVDLAAAAFSTANRRLLIDLGVPRDIEPEVSQIPGVELLDMDDITAFAAGVADGRRREIPKVESILAEEMADYSAEVSAREVAPLIAALHAAGESIRDAELARHRRLLDDLDERQRQMVEALTEALVAKLLHRPSVRLKASAGTPDGEQIAEALRYLFEL